MPIDRRSVLTLPLAALLPGVAFALDAAAPQPHGPVPHARQLRWHTMERYGFVHFTINTFTGKEWGYGDESPALFNPTDFSAVQIVSCARAAGLRGLILTAKHHDGFCLWPSAHTEHSIRRSPYQDGQGDIVREMAEACRAQGLAFGVYLSPWDRHHAEYGRPAYIDYFRAQLRELLTNYGELFELWFDGANGGDGYYGGARELRRIDAATYYDWPTTWRMVRELQPQAVIWGGRGSDARWVGNEEGRAGEPCWATMDEGVFSVEKNLHGVRGGSVWRPAEADVSVRPGWFWHASEDEQVKTPAQLLDIYFDTVGRGASLLLNLAPDQRGQVPARDAGHLAAWGELLRQTFAHNLADGATVRASNERRAGIRHAAPALHAPATVSHADTGTGSASQAARAPAPAVSAVAGGAAQFSAACVLDGRDDTYWATDDAVRTAELTLDLPAPRRFDVVRLREHLPLGQRIARFAVDAWQAGRWRELAAAESVGAQRLIRLPQPITASRLRIRILEADASPVLQEVALFLLPPVQDTPGPGTARRYGLPQGEWAIAPAEAAVLLKQGGAWRASTAGPQELTLDLSKPRQLRAVTLLPVRHPAGGATPPTSYRCEVSLDGQHWTEAATGEFSNIAANAALQTIRLAQPRTVRYVRLHLSAPAAAEQRLTAAELGVLTD